MKWIMSKHDFIYAIQDTRGEEELYRLIFEMEIAFLCT